MKIRTALADNRKKCLRITTSKGSYSLPYFRLNLKPLVRDPIREIFVDKELGETALTYRLRSGKKDSIPLDAFLDYNRDPEYLRQIHLHQLTVKAHELIKQSHTSKRELARRMKTSPTQLYRLLNASNSEKTLDQMIKLLICLDADISITATQRKVA